MDILLAGGTSYIGSALKECIINRGHTPIIADSSLAIGIDYNRDCDTKHYAGDISDFNLIKKIFNENPNIEMCVYCAQIAVPSISVYEPFKYYDENVVKPMSFFKYLNDLNCKKIIFCSSAAVYGQAAGQVVTEKSPANPESPFGRSKYMTEIILKDFCGAYGMNALVLRNFNPIGISPKMTISSLDENTILNNLIKVAEGKLPYFTISGDDWDTRDGTCIRDYIHVLDLAQAHVNAIEMFDEITNTKDGLHGYFKTINIGSGQGVTVKEFIAAFENITGEKIKVVIADKRPGDFVGVYANINRAKKLLNWNPSLPVEEAILGVFDFIERNKYNEDRTLQM